jgi:CheY-like chemotaxis protein
MIRPDIHAIPSASHSVITKVEFYEMVNSAYRSLYDFAVLRNHPLSDYLLRDQQIDLKERGWKVHTLLLKLIDDLQPHNALPLSKEWRRHKLLVLRYVEAMQPNLVAEQLAVSRRQFYREYNLAMDALVDLLWMQVGFAESVKTGAPDHDAEAMQRELARISQYDTSADFAEVLEGILALLEKILQDKQIEIALNIPESMPRLSIGQNLLRQILLAILGVYAEHHEGCVLQIESAAQDQSAQIRFQVEPSVMPMSLAQSALETVYEIVQFAQGQIQALAEGEYFAGLVLDLPTEGQYTILVADDNEDTLALYQRFLSQKPYRVVTTSDAEAVITLALTIQPDFIVLDLMMPKRDGWDLLQALSNQPETKTIPVMICSVLKQKQLALSLGAAGFLAKPFTEQTLLTALTHLKQHEPSHYG